jgi:anti-sigma regulatory factor (Ser/Thr protein kinase)
LRAPRAGQPGDTTSMKPPEADLVITVPARPTAAGDARRAVAEVGLVATEQEPTLLLLVSELVSNSVRHAGMAEDEVIQLRARTLDDCAHVEVCDAGHAGRTPRVREPELDSLRPGGLGLQLVDAMADRWGVIRDEHVTCVWFELACASQGAAVARRLA